MSEEHFCESAEYYSDPCQAVFQLRAARRKLEEIAHIVDSYYHGEDYEEGHHAMRDIGRIVEVSE